MGIYSSMAAIAAPLVILWGASAAPTQARVLVLDETFDDRSQFTSHSFFADPYDDYFGLTDGTSGDFGGAAMPRGLKHYEGFDGSFLTGQDLDGEDATLPLHVIWSGLDISGLDNLRFSGQFAEYIDDSGDIDAWDQLTLAYRIDGGSYQTLLDFRLEAAHPGRYNGVFREDLDGDGRGEGALLEARATHFTRAIAGRGSRLDLRLTVDLNAGDEDFAVDNFRIVGTALAAAPTAVPEPGSPLGLGAIALLGLRRRRRP